MENISEDEKKLFAKWLKLQLSCGPIYLNDDDIGAILKKLLCQISTTV